ncbi:MAG: class I SAM-dependent methyltransferase, partial [Acidobacteriota bacterium]|nr:class I SAM-dependent methyltransferase [Acidobacteriota bacterium]
LANDALSSDCTGFAPVLHPDAPIWFNRLIDELQFRAIRRALELANVSSGARILDVGCGTGRWVRRYQHLGLNAMGADATPRMLDVAQKLGTGSRLVAGEAHLLPFPAGQFDCVTDITVTQHIPVSLQPQVLGEMLRVLKPGGNLILMELIRGKGPHIFPRAPRDWITQTSYWGAELIAWFGQEYLLPDRLFIRAARTMWRASANTPVSLPVSARRHSSASWRIYWGLRRVTASLSAWTDGLAEVICPGGLATHGVFVFRK